MSRRTKLISIVVAVLIIAGAVLALLFWSSFSTRAETGGTKSSSSRAPLVLFNPTYKYKVLHQSASPIIYVGESAMLTLKIRNMGTAIWFKDGDNPVMLGASRPIDRKTIFYQPGASGWFSGNRILMNKSIIYPGQDVLFAFSVTAPGSAGIYREFFTPLAEYSTWMEDSGVHWDITVLDPNDIAGDLPLTVSGMPERYIEINLSSQKLHAYHDGAIVFDFATSTGRVGMDTPKGQTKIYNKYPIAYSEPYDLYMDNWMAISLNGEYGIHSLPYWKLKSGGRLYEGDDHLGQKVSHGCVRVGVEDSKLLYDWVEVGLPVYVID